MAHSIELPRHSHRQRSLPGQDVGSALSRTKQAAKIGLAMAAGLHATADGVDHIRRRDWRSSALIVLNHQREKVEAVGFGRARFWFVVEFFNSC
jgi:hypothetical protein